MNALLIAAHGSRRRQSNEEIKALALSVSNKATSYDLVDCAFLELCSPDIYSGAQQLIERGVTNITVLPYFLVAGQHVAVDIPAEIKRIEQAFPQITLTVLPYFGSSETMVENIVSQSLAQQ